MPLAVEHDAPVDRRSECVLADPRCPIDRHEADEIGPATLRERDEVGIAVARARRVRSALDEAV